MSIISGVFFLEPIPSEHSSYTRVAAIALLFHAMHTHQIQDDELAHMMAENILDAERSFFLFAHERILLRKLLTELQSNKPNQQMPIP
jgi:hypothetical protein